VSYNLAWFIFTLFFFSSFIISLSLSLSLPYNTFFLGSCFISLNITRLSRITLNRFKSGRKNVLVFLSMRVVSKGMNLHEGRECARGDPRTENFCGSSCTAGRRKQNLELKVSRSDEIFGRVVTSVDVDAIGTNGGSSFDSSNFIEMYEHLCFAIVKRDWDSTKNWQCASSSYHGRVKVSRSIFWTINSENFCVKLVY